MGSNVVKIRNFAITLAVITLSACGGGGSSGGSSSSGTVTYTGATTQASIDGTSSPKLASVVVQAQDSGNFISSMPTAASVSNSTPPGILGIAKIVSATVTNTMQGPGGPTAAMGASTQIAGCSGTITYTVTSSSSTAATESFTFSNFAGYASGSSGPCAAQTINGSLSANITFGTYGSTPYPISMTLTFNNLTAYYSSNQTISLNGSFTLSLNYDATYTTVTGFTFGMDYAFYDSSTGLTYKASGYQLTLDAYFEPIQVSGKVYEPQHGYVNISTPTPLTYSSCTNGHPDSGDIHLIGTDGYADLQPVDCSHYQILWSNTAAGTSGTYGPVAY